MAVTRRLLSAACLFALCITTAYSRSIQPDFVDLVLNDSPVHTEDDISPTDLAAYRHQFDHSMDIQALRWSLRKLQADELCEFCDIMVPLVGGHAAFD